MAHRPPAAGGQNRDHRPPEFAPAVVHHEEAAADARRGDPLAQIDTERLRLVESTRVNVSCWARQGGRK